MKFVLMIGVVSFFADFTYEGSRSVIGPYLGMLGAGPLAISVITGLGEFLGREQPGQARRGLGLSANGGRRAIVALNGGGARRRTRAWSLPDGREVCVSLSLCPHVVVPASEPGSGAEPTDLSGARLEARVSHLYECEQLSTRQVAAATGVSRPRVASILRGAGVTVKARGAGRRRRPDPRVELIEELYVGGRLSSTRISELTGIPSRTIRGWLHARGVPVRTRGRMSREVRTAAPAEPLKQLYLRDGLSAVQTGQLLGMSHRVVLRTAHDLGLPVRLGGNPPSHGPAEIELVDALYADELVRAALAHHGVEAVPAGGAIGERFPARIALSPDLLTELYVRCGLGLHHIELLCGIPAETVRTQLRGQGIRLRPAGGRSRSCAAGGARAVPGPGLAPTWCWAAGTGTAARAGNRR
jgi:hypothetical protein